MACNGFAGARKVFDPHAAFDPVKTSAGSGKDEIPFSTAQPVALDRTLRSAATLQV